MAKPRSTRCFWTIQLITNAQTSHMQLLSTLKWKSLQLDPKIHLISLVAGLICACFRYAPDRIQDHHNHITIIRIIDSKIYKEILLRLLQLMHGLRKISGKRAFSPTTHSELRSQLLSKYRSRYASSPGFSGSAFSSPPKPIPTNLSCQSPIFGN